VGTLTDEKFKVTDEEFKEFWESHPDTKPCPFCGRDNHLVVNEEFQARISTSFGFRIECTYCGAMSGNGVSEPEEAWIFWQMRH
jgi:hypothetical protein